MKKILLAAAIVGSAFMANAQEFAPSKGSFSTEIQFSPFSGDVFSNGGVLEGRYFFSDKDACIIEFGLSGTNDKTVSDTNMGDAFTKTYNGEFVLNIGYQRHFYTYKRIDLYAGGKIGYVHQFAGNKEQTAANNWDWNNKGTGNGFNLYATTGIDFYVYKGLYVGAEINAGFTDVVTTNYKTKWNHNGETGELKSSIGGHHFNGGFSVDPRFRLGWTF